MDLINILIVFLVGTGASVYGTLVGGSSLIIIPLLILMGLPPHAALGTDRVGVVGLSIAGWYKFHQKRLVNYRVGFSMVLPALTGSFIGAKIVLQINEAALKLIIAGLTVLMVLFMVLRPDVGIDKTREPVTVRDYLLGALMTFLVGIYAGFYGAMAGTFLFYILLLWFKQTFLESAGTLKVAGFFMNVMAAAVFAMNGAVDYPLGIVLFAGSFIGSFIGAHYSDKLGNVWIRRFFILIIAIMIIKLVI
ncbi:MAG: sulfite exporter TauE/SafE family protein [Thermodesulfobacteriota bacterium]